jgi:ribosome-binding factor A
MSVDRLKRVNELLRREIGEALYHLLRENEVDLAAVTVTEVQASRDLQQARVLVSIRDHAEERDRILRAIESHRGEMQALINRRMQLKYTPRLRFVLDRSLEKGDRVLGMLNRMEEAAELPPAEEEGAP